MLDDPAKLGLPDYANGNAEGYLFPSTYDFGPNDKPADMLKKMVDRWQQAADDARPRGGRCGRSATRPHEIMTIASMIEAEGRGDYRAKIARVIYNRLEIDPNPAAGFLQIDATVNYALGRPGPAVLTTEEIDSVADSPYNTYTHRRACRPGPIEAPGEESIKAALNPEDGPWFFYVTTNLATGETKFTDELQRVPDRSRASCRSTARPSPTAADRPMIGVWGAGRPDRALAVAGCCTGRRTTRAVWTGSTTRTGCRPVGSRRSSTASDASWRGLSVTAPLKREAADARRRGLADGDAGRGGQHPRARRTAGGTPTTPTSPGRRRRSGPCGRVR